MSVPAAPQLAATLLLVRDDPFEVLMIRRRAGDSFGSALVFPGGVVDPGDWEEEWIGRLAGGEGLPAEQRALRIAAIRETYEEAGVIAAAQGPVACAIGMGFGDALGAALLKLDALVPFGHWITPVIVARRFDTHFFLCAVSRDVEAACDGVEAIALEWARPADLLARAEAGEQSLLFPTRMNLARLAESRSAAEALEAARRRPIVPVLVEIERRADGILHRLPPDAGYALSEFFTPH
ncbi:8-oxo-dGTP pyrophosphatase MutT (NUDIX family) [Sphingomonas vulcanisoli]|uniref:8-oxo-dGTP pyrophosphatase MutT (NUDIX family) n=1 Tax=Sphingomonas vulcanisoli TaxID=1658060 RepID=A0ABX0TRI7_9SPHN|nr:NUDIX hydrolase [Sphingomonas vulcanisoli]NIJ07349.1 8-oxo-dGTP pyrophosphatase MutT (NUDIX family) [Sphingomonas vulcanisoli]